MNKNKLKEYLYTFGKLLSLLSIVFIFYKIYQEYSLGSFYTKIVQFIDISPYLILLNILSLLTGVYVWYTILRHYSTKSFGYLTAYYYFAKTEVAKYLPGNIFHLVGRQALASKLGIKHTQMAKITFFHTIVLLFGTVVSASLLALVAEPINEYYKLAAVAATVFLIIVTFFIYPIFSKLTKLTMLMIIALSIAMQGAILAWIVAYQAGNYSYEYLSLLASVYVISWIIGFVTPGASGGLGVREGAFIAIVSFLHINVAEDIVVFSVIFVRFINIIVDLLLYLCTFLFKKYELH
jgi:hypothetical protein